MSVRYIAVAAAAAAATAAVVATATSAIATTPAQHYRTVTAAAVRPQVNGQVGWQGEYTYTVPTGLGSLLFHYSCPAGLVAESGGFSASTSAQTLTEDGPRWDSADNQWWWFFTWAGRSPAGETISFDTYCTNVP